MPINSEKQPDIDSLLAELRAKSPELYHQIQRRLGQLPKVQLEVVLYRPVSKSVKSKSDTVFAKARVDFLSRMATHYPHLLKQAGIDDAGLLCLEMGIAPHNAAGEAYAVNIDHILQRSGFPAKEEDIPELSNAYSNLVLIDYETHNLKTSMVHEQTRDLHDKTKASSGDTDNSKWIVMLAPDGYPQHLPVSIMNPAQTTTLDAKSYFFRYLALSRKAGQLMIEATENSSITPELLDKINRLRDLAAVLRARAAEASISQALKPAPQQPPQGKPVIKKPSIWSKPRGLW